MKIINQSYEIISLPDNLLQVIEAAGKTCYKSEDKIGCATYLEHTPSSDSSINASITDRVAGKDPCCF